MAYISVNELLFEAYRRLDMGDEWERSKPLLRRWVGLGTAAAYRPVIEAGYMMFHNGITPPARCMGWLVLTEKGVEKLKELEPIFSERLRGWKTHTDYPSSILANYMLAGGLE